MARLIIGIAFATLVSLSAVAHADAKGTKSTHAGKGTVSMSPFVFTKKFDKSSPSLN